MSVEDRTRAALLAAGRAIDPDTEAMFVGVETAIHRHNVRRRALLAVAGAAAVAGVAFGASVVGQHGPDIAPAGPGNQVTATPPGVDPAAVIEAYVRAYNADNVDAVMAWFSEDAAVTDHPGGLADAVGADAIRRLTITDRSWAAQSDPYEISNLNTDGDTVTWDHTWTNNNGEHFCADGNRAVITDGLIVSWTYADNADVCE